jgi:cyclopropane fatty-acyl-phospholipid synthase-like methyltransferase
MKVAFNVIADLEFDLRYGTDTMRRVEKDALPGSSSYSATKARGFRTLMRKLDLPKASVFVDLGSGKGRVLLLAAQYGFEKVVGVEYSQSCA